MRPLSTLGTVTQRRRLLVAWGVLAVAAGIVKLPVGHSQAASIRFAVVGDFGNDSAPEGAVANIIAGWNPDFVITTGDNNYPSGAADTIDTNIGKYYHAFISPYQGTFGSGSTINRFFPVLGNHDWGNTYPNPTGANPYLAYFTLPNNERYYEFVKGPMHFFAVDSDDNEPDGNTSNSVQAAWLRTGLAASTAPWRLVYFHHPAYSSGSVHGSATWMQWPFKDWGVNAAVMSGHDHFYERLTINGLLYFVNGAGGVSLYNFSSTPVPGSQVRYNDHYGAQLVEADGTSIRFRFINAANVLIDDYTIAKVAVPTSPSNLTATAFSSTQIDLAWADNSNDESGFRIERSSDGTNFSQVATTAPNVATYSDMGLQASTTYYYRVRAYNTGGDSGASDVAQAQTFAGSPARPNAPTGLTAKTASASQINLAWTDNADNEETFQIERANNGSDFIPIKVVGANVIAYSDTTLQRNTRYYYRVRASNTVGDSAYSNTAAAKTRNR